MVGERASIEDNPEDISPAVLRMLADKLAYNGDPSDVISTTRGTLVSLLRSVASANAVRLGSENE